MYRLKRQCCCIISGGDACLSSVERIWLHGGTCDSGIVFVNPNKFTQISRWTGCVAPAIVSCYVDEHLCDQRTRYTFCLLYWHFVHGPQLALSASENPPKQNMTTTSTTKRRCQQVHNINCYIIVGGRHFWLFVLADGPPYILYTYIIYHVYTLYILTTIYSCMYI